MSSTWQIFLAIFLIVASLVLYFIQFLFFHSPMQSFFYFLQDFAFVPIEVLFVTLILKKLIDDRQKKIRLQKMNMVIGTFFSETGRELLILLSKFDKNPVVFSQISIDGSWKSEMFTDLRKFFNNRQYEIESRISDLEELKVFLTGRRSFILSLLGNPNLLEHDKITDMLWAVFHLTDELVHRNQLKNLSEKDYDHLSIDIARAYKSVVLEWLSYMGHLRKDYPYLFSLAVRLNPFNPDFTAEIR